MAIKDDVKVFNENKIDKSESDLTNQDWPNLGFYQQDNLKLRSKSSIGRVVFMGDSITEGWAQLDPDFFSKPNYINRGIGGQTTPQMLIRFKPDVLDLEPSLIFLLAGTNDIAGNTGYSTIKMITDNLFSMAELAKVNGIKVVLSSILPVYNYPWNENIIKPYKTISKINNLMKDYVHKNSLLYIDYFSNMVNNKEGLKSEYTTDGVHPSEGGYKVMSKIANNFILRNLN
tara:strand:+ start:1212 stop:1901 length:690 start_codon:yes stop_codon:yes gene_type:complete